MVFFPLNKGRIEAEESHWWLLVSWDENSGLPGSESILLPLIAEISVQAVPWLLEADFFLSDFKVKLCKDLESVK